MIAQGDAYRIPLPDKSVHTVCTSPPYWGLRKYAGEQGDKPLGLESTPEFHVERIVEICREVRRVLRDDGVFWLNYGDSYSGSGGEHGNAGLDGKDKSHRSDLDHNPRRGAFSGQSSSMESTDQRRRPLGGGSLMMMPHRVALALQQDGWIIRQDLVWFKRNPMPESIAGTRWVQHRIKEGRSKHAADHNIKGGTQKMLEDASVHQGIDEDWVPKYIDCPGCEKCIPNDGLVLKRGSWRHTRAHEYVFMLIKGMQYWSNQEAVREGTSNNTHSRGIKRDPPIDHAGQGHDAWVSYMDRDAEIATAGRNPRSVLDVPTAPYKGAHYATFPPNLIAPLIRATCPRWACPVCGQGWAAVVEKGERIQAHWEGTEQAKINTDGARGKHGATSVIETGSYQSYRALGYHPTCEHEHTQEEAVPGIVFDPFVGSGTTVAVAQQLLRRGIGIDISMEYLDQQAKIRAGLGTPSNALDDLPLFGNIMAIKAE